LRDHLKKVEAENNQLRTAAMSSLLDTLGLQPDAGLGKAIVKEYRGEYTVEALSEYAKTEYGHEHGTQEPTPAVTAAEKIAAVTSQSQAVTPAPTVDPATEAAAKMHDPEAGREEAAQSIAAKMAQFSQEHYPHQQGQPGPQQ
jgi:hypothetical protein